MKLWCHLETVIQLNLVKLNSEDLAPYGKTLAECCGVQKTPPVLISLSQGAPGVRGSAESWSCNNGCGRCLASDSDSSKGVLTLKLKSGKPTFMFFFLFW